MAIKINLMPQKEGAAPSGELRTPFYSLIIFVLFVICLLVYSGIYAYNTFYLKKQLDEAEKKNADIQTMISKSVTPEDALTVIGAIVKGRNIRTILASHLYQSKIYELLEKITIKSVSYNKFSEKKIEGKTITIAVSGEAGSFNALAKQLMILKKTKEIKDVVFLEGLVEKDGKVGFSLNLTFDLSLVTTRPEITLSGPSSVSIQKNSVYSDAGATAIDGVDGVISVTTSGEVNTKIAGTYTLTYTAVNAVGNFTTAARTIEVIE